MGTREGDQLWLQDFVCSKFYQKCHEKEENETTNFCRMCRGKPFCEECKINKHQGHPNNILRVIKASHHAAINVEIIEEFFDVSAIQTYKFNKKIIVFISHRQRNGRRASNSKISGSKCKICGWSNLSTLFCSIECKINCASEEGKSINCSMEKENRSNQNLPLEECKNITRQGSNYRKRRRKGNPVRAPFLS